MTAERIRDHLVNMIGGDDAHVGFEKVIDLPPEARGIRPSGAAHSAWEILEHMRIALWDILEFSRDPNHQSPPWPQGYWPQGPEPPDDDAWEASVSAFLADRRAMQELVADPQVDLVAPIPHGTGQTVFREAALVAKHNSYHLGELVVLRRLLGVWV